MMPRRASQAEQLRAHREAFTLAMKLDCTPREAAEKLRLQRAIERNREATARLDAKLSGEPHKPKASEQWDAKWMMRD